jgi:hypothetical protein
MKKLLYIFGGLVILLIITNPSVTAFKTYLGRDSYGGLRRPVNLFICAFYKDRSHEYFGMIGNFWKLNKSKNPTLDSLRKVDSTRTVDSANMAAMDTSVHPHSKQWQPPAKDSLISK